MAQELFVNTEHPTTLRGGCWCWYTAIARAAIDRQAALNAEIRSQMEAIFTHHGHKRNVRSVAEVFAAQFRGMFGRTKYAYAHMGHLHHVDVKENNLMIVEQHRTLAAADAYTARGGWMSGRDAKVITYHRGFGEVGRITVSYDMVRDAVKV